MKKLTDILHTLDINVSLPSSKACVTWHTRFSQLCCRRFQVLWDITSCRPVTSYQHFIFSVKQLSTLKMKALWSYKTLVFTTWHSRQSQKTWMSSNCHNLFDYTDFKHWALKAQLQKNRIAVLVQGLSKTRRST